MDEKGPRLGCAVVVRRGETILLGQRGKEPHYGKWIIPGGKVSFLEPIRDAGRREIREETGLETELGEFIGVYELISPPTEHRVVHYYWGSSLSGEVRPASDLLDARFYSKGELRGLIERGEVTEFVARVLRDIGWYQP